MMAASKVTERGMTCVVIEKGKAIGGRLCNKRIGGACINIGTVLTTAKSEQMQSVINKCLDSGEAQGLDDPLLSDDPMYYGKPTASTIVKSLRSGKVDMELQARALVVSCENGKIVVGLDGEKHSITGASCIITAPVPQCVTMIQAGNLDLPPKNCDWHRDVQYDSCIVIAAELDKPCDLREVEIINKGSVYMISNDFKLGTSSTPALSIRSTTDFANQYCITNTSTIYRDTIDKGNLNQAADQMLKDLGGCIGSDIISFYVHLWRYNQAKSLYPSECVNTTDGTNYPPVVVAGDAFGDKKWTSTERAILSGHAAANLLL